MIPVALVVHAPAIPEHLDLCLAALYGQTFEDFEVLVTDTDEASDHDEVVNHHAKHLAQPIRHIHMPGGSLNLGRALNAAVLSTEAEYVIFLGGNCIAPHGFIAAHLAVADYGYFAHGETLPLDAILTNALDAAALGTGQAFDEAWVQAVSPKWHAQNLRGSALGMVKRWLQKDTPGQQYWNCESSSCFRADLLAIDGFDMDVDDWRVDRDLANRLQNNGHEPVATDVHGNVLRLLNPESVQDLRTGGRVPAQLEPGGEVMAVSGLRHLAPGSKAA